MRSSDLRDLKRFELLAELDDTDHQVLAQEFVVREIESETRLFELGDPSDALLLVMEGCVRIRSPKDGGEFADLFAGSCIGALSLTGFALHEARADTAERSTIFELSRQKFERLVVSEPRTACHLLQAILRDQVAILYEAAQALGTNTASSP